MSEMNILQRDLYYNLLLDFDELQEQDYQPRRFFAPIDPFDDLTGDEFLKIYRLTKERVTQVIDIVRQYQPPLARRSALSVPRKVLTALRFFATGSYQLDIGLSRYSAVSQPSVSRCINTVIDVINRPEVLNEYVHFHRNFQEIRQARNRFLAKFQFPNAIGCIDCTHIAIVPPAIDNPVYPEHVYVNRKLYHSLNVQLICDADFKILNVNSRFPGSSHDCAIWNDSNVQRLMRRIHRHGNERFYLLGDSGYPLRPWLLTPYRNPLEGSPEAAYNTSFCRARSIIERVNGILKMRFRCLLKHRVLHYRPTTASKIVNTCVVLHNMAIQDGFHVPDVIGGIEENNPEFGMFDDLEPPPEDPMARVNPELVAGRNLRDRIVNQWFNE